MRRKEGEEKEEEEEKKEQIFLGLGRVQILV